MIDSYRYAIALISNQAGGPKLATDFVNKLPSICRKIDIPLRAFAAFDFNEYRKGSPAIWYAFEVLFNEGIAIGSYKTCLAQRVFAHSFARQVDYASSFYVGDAAGRPGDHNDTDRSESYFSRPLSSRRLSRFADNLSSRSQSSLTIAVYLSSHQKSTSWDSLQIQIGSSTVSMRGRTLPLVSRA